MITYHDETLPEGMLLKSNDGFFELRYNGVLLCDGNLSMFGGGFTYINYKGKNPDNKKVIDKIVSDFQTFFIKKREEENKRQKKLEDLFRENFIKSMEDQTDSAVNNFMAKEALL